jgi:hypothetical protein
MSQVREERPLYEQMFNEAFCRGARPSTEEASSAVLDENKHQKSTYVFVNRIESSQRSDSISIDVITANEHLVFKGILDSGAEATIVLMRFAQRILELDSNVTLSKLDLPITVDLPNGATDEIHYEMCLDLVLQSKAI